MDTNKNEQQLVNNYVVISIMEFGKKILSLVTVLSLVVIAFDSTIPPCQDLGVECTMSQEETVAKPGSHHNHVFFQNLLLNNNHFAHESHSEESIYDFITCLLLDIKFPDIDCNLKYLNLLTPKSSSHLSLEIKFTTSVISSFIPKTNLTKIIKKNHLQRDGSYQSPQLRYSPLRAPPIFSC